MDELLFELKGKNSPKDVSFNFKYLVFLWLILFFLTSSFFFYLQLKVKKQALILKDNFQYLTFFYFPPRGDIYDRNGKLIATSKETYDVYADLDSLTDEEKKVLDEIIKLYQPLTFHWGNELILKFLDLEKVNKILAFKENYPHLFVIPSYERVYLGGEELGNLIGYIGLSTQSEIPGEFVGLGGIELYYDDYLRGKIGKVVFQKTKEGLKKVYEEKPVKGNDLYLTIDFDLQREIYKLMKEYFETHGYQKGSFILTNPHSGEVISLISYPSFDPKVFLKERHKAQEVLSNPLSPLFNRAIGGLYPPGSTIKPLIASAALEEKIVTPQTLIYSPGEIKIPHPYFPNVYTVFKDNKVHGWTDIYKAIADSVNVYFYVVGGGYPEPNEYFPLRYGLGAKRIVSYLKKFGLDEKSGIDLPGEKAGYLPSKEKLDKNWRLGDTYNLSIGQGEILVTPLRINLWTSFFATEGKIFKPYIVKKIVSPDKKIIFEAKPVVLKENLISLENLKIIKEAMRLTVVSGTAKMLSDLPIKLAGKSGSPEVLGKRKLHAIFTGFAPYPKPQINFTLMIEEVPYGSVASLPLLKEILILYHSKIMANGGDTF